MNRDLVRRAGKRDHAAGTVVSRPARPSAASKRLPKVGKVAMIALLSCGGIVGSSWGKDIGIISSDVSLSKPAGASDYKLGPLDKIRLRAFEWRASRDEVYEWKALNAEYSIGAGGKLFLPLIGEVDTANLTASELSRVVAGRLRDRMGLAEAPDVSVEVVEFRPFYITGDVQKPGEFAFRPGLTLLQAVTIAGGYIRPNDVEAGRVAREIISVRGDMQVFDSELVVLLARKARLEAELTDESEINFPRAVVQRAATDDSVGLLLRQEQLFFKTRKASFDAQLGALEQLRTFLEAEKNSLVARIEKHVTQLKLVREEFTNITSLYKKGLATSPRKLALEQTIAQLDGEQIRLETELARSNQEVSKASIAIADLRNKRMTETTSEALTTRSKLAEVTHKSRTAGEIMEAAAVTQPTLLSMVSNDGRQPNISYKIGRLVDGRPVELDGNEATVLEPGDAIKVHISGASAAGKGSGAAIEASIPAATPDFKAAANASFTPGPDAVSEQR